MCNDFAPFLDTDSSFQISKKLLQMTQQPNRVFIDGQEDQAKRKTVQSKIINSTICFTTTVKRN